MKTWTRSSVLSVTLIFCACDSSTSGTGGFDREASADITAVTFTGDAGNYSFTVTIESPDTGCSQYADWWEVIGSDGRLVYRRILTHSHVNEQPFTRSGGPVNISATENIFVRAHMNSSGYGEQVFSGSIEQGLQQNTLDSFFADELELTDPLPDGCAF